MIQALEFSVELVWEKTLITSHILVILHVIVFRIAINNQYKINLSKYKMIILLYLLYYTIYYNKYKINVKEQ